VPDPNRSIQRHVIVSSFRRIELKARNMESRTSRLAALLIVLLAASCGARHPAVGPHQAAAPRGDTSAKIAASRRSGTEEARHKRRRNRPRASHRPRGTDKATILGFGAHGSEVASLQRKLEALGYWIGDRSGDFGNLTQQAVFAFQGVESLARDGEVGPHTRAALASASRPQPRGAGNLVEVDKSRQVLFVVRHGVVKWVFHVSTGSNETYRRRSGKTALANTPDGKWKVIYQYRSGWHKSPLGRLWRPKYFHPSGIAIHGFRSVPPFPASHGCVRVSIEAMNFIWTERLAPMGSTVWVY
jgi:peptidoglycan hydrolase-like protein with peptidoglycan-binding domain